MDKFNFDEIKTKYFFYMIGIHILDPLGILVGL